MTHVSRIAGVFAIVAGFVPFGAQADTCAQLFRASLTHGALKNALVGVVPTPGLTLDPALPNGGLGFSMWLTLVDGSGVVCTVVNSLTGTAHNADNTADIWLGSRVISAQ